MNKFCSAGQCKCEFAFVENDSDLICNASSPDIVQDRSKWTSCPVIELQKKISIKLEISEDELKFIKKLLHEYKLTIFFNMNEYQEYQNNLINSLIVKLHALEDSHG